MVDYNCSDAAKIKFHRNDGRARSLFNDPILLTSKKYMYRTILYNTALEFLFSHSQMNEKLLRF